MNKLSIIIPIYNEENTIRILLDKIRDIVLINDTQKEIVIVNDGSIDNSENEIFDFIKHNQQLTISYQKHEQNKGKGAAIQTGLLNAKGNLIVIQDADLEYDPVEYNSLLKPVIDGFADVVYGSRFISGNPHRILLFWNNTSNKILTLISNIFTNLNLSDALACYKLFKAQIIKSIILKENGFGFESEVTAKISKISKIRIYEVGISYYGRTYEEGKKIKLKDAFRILYCIIKYNIFSK